jgi:hypothetical protein
MSEKGSPLGDRDAEQGRDERLAHGPGDVMAGRGVSMRVAFEQDGVALDDDQARGDELFEEGLAVVGATEVVKRLGQGVGAPRELENVVTSCDRPGVQDLVHVLEVVGDPVRSEDVGKAQEARDLGPVDQQGNGGQDQGAGEPARPATRSRFRGDFHRVRPLV